MAVHECIGHPGSWKAFLAARAARGDQRALRRLTRQWRGPAIKSDDNRLAPSPLAAGERVGAASFTTCQAVYGSVNRRARSSSLARPAMTRSSSSCRSPNNGSERSASRCSAPGVPKSGWRNSQRSEGWKLRKSVSADPDYWGALEVCCRAQNTDVRLTTVSAMSIGKATRVKNYVCRKACIDLLLRRNAFTGSRQQLEQTSAHLAGTSFASREATKRGGR